MKQTGFLARQPIVDIQGKIIGYELLYRPTIDATTAGYLDDLDAGSLALLYLMSGDRTEQDINSQTFFIKAGDKVLKSDLLSLIKPKSAIFELQNTALDNPDCLPIIESLHSQGHILVLENFSINPEYSKFWKYADYIKFDIRNKDERNIFAISKIVSSGSKAQLIAEKVETQESFELARRCGITLFQGYYFAKPSNLISRPINPSVTSVVKLINLIKKEASVKELEEVIKKEPSLAFRMLKYVNSAAFGLRMQIESFKHAIAVVGYKKLYKWLSIMVMHANATTPTALIKTALLRARLMENLLGELCGTKEKDEAFVVGMFSLLDVFLQIPLEQAVEQLVLSDEIKEAILSHNGIYGPYLELTKTVEGGDSSKTRKLLDELFMTEETLNKHHLEAIHWVDSIEI